MKSWFWALLALLVLTTPAWAQALSTAELKKRSQALSRQKRREVESLAALQARAAKRHERALQKRKQLALKLLTLEQQRLSLTEGVKQKRQALKLSEAKKNRWAKERQGITARVQIFAEQLQFFFQEQPAAAKSEAQVQTFLKGLKAQGVGDWALLMASTEQAYRWATELNIESAEVWTAKGQREAVELLRLGGLSYVYKTESDGRWGLALASPSDASGYRWTEALKPETQAALARVWSGLKSKSAARLAIPMDASRRLRVEALLERKSMADQLKAGGWVMVPLGILALLALLLIVERQWVFWRQSSPSRVVAEVMSKARERQWAPAQEAAERGSGLVCRVLSAALRARERGAAAMENAIQEQLLYEQPRLSKRLGGLAVLGAVAPLLGLLGTVTGIIQTFGIIKVFGNTNPGLMAGGISEALITTATGLVVAIPILLCHSYLNGRMDRSLSDAEKFAATLLNILSNQAPAEAAPESMEAARESPSEAIEPESTEVDS